jgi:hypothetical protein
MSSILDKKFEREINPDQLARTPQAAILIAESNHNAFDNATTLIHALREDHDIQHEIYQATEPIEVAKWLINNNINNPEVCPILEIDAGLDMGTKATSPLSSLISSKEFKHLKSSIYKGLDMMNILLSRPGIHNIPFRFYIHTNYIPVNILGHIATYTQAQRNNWQYAIDTNRFMGFEFKREIPDNFNDSVIIQMLLRHKNKTQHYSTFKKDEIKEDIFKGPKEN